MRIKFEVSLTVVIMLRMCRTDSVSHFSVMVTMARERQLGVRLGVRPVVQGEPLGAFGAIVDNTDCTPLCEQPEAGSNTVLHSYVGWPWPGAPSGGWTVPLAEPAQPPGASAPPDYFGNALHNDTGSPPARPRGSEQEVCAPFRCPPVEGPNTML